MYTRPGGLSGIITDYSQVSDAGLAHALSYLSPSQASYVQSVGGAMRLSDPQQLAMADGLIQQGQAGMPLWSLVHESIGAPSAGTSQGNAHLSFADVIRQYPQLTALLVAREAWAAPQGAPADIQQEYSTPDAVLSLITTRASQQGRFQTSVALPDDISAADAAPYLQAVTHYLNALYAEIPGDVAAERDNTVSLALSLARQVAMSRGTTTFPGLVGGSGLPIEVATELIHYHVELPDGTMYVVMDDVTGDPANRYVYQWLGPNWKPMEATGGWYERNGKSYCVGIVKGTGSWYTARVFGQIAPGDSCDATPDNFTGPWDLITPDISAALTYQSGDPVKVVPPAQQVTVTPAVTPYTQGPTTPPASPSPTTSPIPSPASSPGGSGGGGQVAPVETVVPYTGPSPVLLQPSPNDPVVVSTLPAPAPAAPGMSSGVLLLLGAGAIFLATRKGK